LIPINAIAFTIATTNSYFMNKKWAFHDQSHIHEGKKVSLFLLVSLVGVAINTSIVYTIRTFVPAVLDLEVEQWLAVAKVAATGISLVWNFIGYKLIVFRK
jgi:putative flippase GtrA